MDPILKYLLDFNKTESIEYHDRYVIPPGGLEKMLTDFKGFHLNKITVTKDEVLSEAKPEAKQTVEELYALLD